MACLYRCSMLERFSVPSGAVPVEVGHRREREAEAVAETREREGGKEGEREQERGASGSGRARVSSWVARPAPSERLPDRRTPCGARALLLSDERRGRLDSDASGREAHCPPPCSGRRPSSARAGWRAAARRREAERDTRKHARQLLRGWWQRRRAAIGVARHYAVPLFRSHAAAWGRACDGPQPLVALHEVDHLGAAVELLRERRAEARLDECQQVLIRHVRNATVEERLSPQREAQTPTSHSLLAHARETAPRATRRGGEGGATWHSPCAA